MNLSTPCYFLAPSLLSQILISHHQPLSISPPDLLITPSSDPLETLSLTTLAPLSYAKNHIKTDTTPDLRDEARGWCRFKNGVLPQNLGGEGGQVTI